MFGKIAKFVKSVNAKLDYYANSDDWRVDVGVDGTNRNQSKAVDWNLIEIAQSETPLAAHTIFSRILKIGVIDQQRAKDFFESLTQYYVNRGYKFETAQAVAATNIFAYISHLDNASYERLAKLFAFVIEYRR